MKNTFWVFLALIFTVSACKKSSPTAPAPALQQYMSFTAASTWQYSLINNIASTTTDYTLTSTSRDSSINGRLYHVFTNSNTGGSEYYYITSNDYYSFRTLALAQGNVQLEDLYLKDNSAVNTSWNESVNVTVPGVPVPVPVTITYTILEKGINRTVNNIAYADVIHVGGVISSSMVPSANLVTDIENYYTRKFGMIESNNKINLNYLGITQNTDNKIILLSADIK